MKSRLCYILFFMLLICMIPYIMTIGLSKKEKKTTEIRQKQSGYVVQIGKKTVDLEEYIVGVIQSQISLDNQLETIKAQVVLLRTDLIRRMGSKKTINQNDLPYTYENDRSLKEKLGKKEFQAKNIKRKKAVADTYQKVLTYKGKCIQPYYHGISIGTTLSGKEWFHREIGYLQAKESYQDIEAKDYMQMKELTYKEVISRLKSKYQLNLTVKDAKNTIQIEDSTKTGYVKKVRVKDRILTGESWANCFSLQSTNFYLEHYHGKFRMIALGKGNGLGMSQYGANEMAKEKKSYKKILTYYFSNTKIETIHE